MIKSHDNKSKTLIYSEKVPVAVRRPQLHLFPIFSPRNVIIEKAQRLEMSCCCTETRWRDKQSATDRSEEKILFNPPLYIQRYNLALQLIQQQQPKTVVDVGCGDCTLLKIVHDKAVSKYHFVSIHRIY